MKTSTLPQLLLALAALFILPLKPLQGATIIWTNASGGNWNVAANWSPNQVPGAADTAIATNDGNYTITLNVDHTVGNFVLGATSGSTTQALTISSGSLATGTGIVNSRGAATLDNGSLSGTNVFDGVVNWTGGFISGRLTITPNGALLLTGSGQKGFSLASVDNAGRFVWGGSGRLVIQVQSVITNLAGGLFEVQSDAVLFPAGAETNAFHNFGTFRKSSSAGSTTFQTYFHNYGIVDVQTGSLVFDSGKGFFNDGCSFTGAGATLLTGGEFYLNGKITSQNLQLTSLSVIIFGTNTIAGTVVCSSGVWAGWTTIATNGTLLLPTGGQKNFYNTFVNGGNVTWSGGTFFVINGINFTNLAGAIFESKSDDTMQSFAAGPNSFYNLGTFRKSAGAGTTTVNAAFHNSGNVDTQTGLLAINPGAAGVTISDGSSYTGAGITQLGEAVYTMSGTVTSQNLHINSLNASLTGTKTIVGTVVCSSGSWQGNTTIATNGTLLLPGGGQKNFYDAIVNAGTLSWSGGILFLINGASFTNQPGALFDSAFDGTLLPFGTGTPLIHNGGTVRKSAGAGNTTISPGVQVINNGTVEGRAGTLLFSANTYATYANPAGTIAVAGGKVQFDSNLILPAGAIIGSGTVQAPNINSSATISPGETNAVLTLSGNLVQQNSGSLEFDLGGTAPGANHSQVIVTGSAKLGGTITLRYSPGYSPAVGTSNVVITAAALSGQFPCQNYFFLLGENKRMTAIYNPANLTLTALAAPDPTLPILGIGGQSQPQRVVTCWPAEFAGYSLYSKTNLSQMDWTLVTSTTNRLLESPLATQKFFRLSKPAP